MVDLIAQTPCEGLLPIKLGAWEFTEALPGPITSIMPYDGQEEACDEALKSLHGITIPKPGRSVANGDMRAIWTGEHHGMEFTIAPNPLISLVDLSHHTKNVKLGTGTVIAPFWHPIKLAGEAAYADLLTGGRIELGIARGAYSYEYERLMPGLDA